MSSTDLEKRARRAYERGRTRMALEWCCLIVVMMIGAVLLCQAPLLTCVVGSAVFILSFVLIHRGKDAGRGAKAGIQAGLLTNAALLCMRTIEIKMGADWSGAYGWACCAFGICGGASIMLRKGARSGSYVASGAVIAGMCSCLGCVMAGALGIGAALAGLAIAAVPTVVLRRARS